MPPTVLVTGANKGIGLEIVRGLVKKGYYTFLGSRDVERGEAARESLGDDSAMVQVVQLDVSSEASVKSAYAEVMGALGGAPLSGLINNAGGVPAGSGMGFSTPEAFVATMELNYLHSAVRVTEAFLPLLDKESGKGRVVMVASGAAPSYVGKCAAERQAALCDWDTTSMEGLTAVYKEAVGIATGHGGDADKTKAAFAAAGLDDGAPYHLSKALMNGYTQVLAKKYDKMIINACSPGFIETDLTRPFATMSGKTPAEMGMKPVEEGAKSSLFLMTEDFVGHGWYWGSDCERSPMDKYRSPFVDPPYTGGESAESSKQFLTVGKGD